MVHCVFIGPWKDKRLKALADDYDRRLDRLWPVKILEIPETPKAVESFLERKSGQGVLVSLDADGRRMDSPEFGRSTTQNAKDLYLVVWGAEGPRPGWKARTGSSWSLSPLTTSHELARVLLLEQLYRAAAVLRGHPYPK